MTSKIILHPLVIIGGAFIAGSTFKNRSPVWPGWALPSAFEHVGMALIVAGMMVLGVAYTALARTSTTINPRRATTDGSHVTRSAHYIDVAGMRAQLGAGVGGPASV